jgi:hypothetical protein
MRKALATLLLLAVVATVAPQAAARDCPDMRTTHVRAEVVTSKTSTRCGVGISVFGLEIRLFGPNCPAARFTYPSHEVCAGAPAIGFRCALPQALQVIYERCNCSSLTALGTGVLLPHCDCQVQPGGGTVLSWTTVPCGSY